LLRIKVAAGRVENGVIVTSARFREGARVRIIEEDGRPPVGLAPGEEAGMLRGIQEFREGKGLPIAGLRAKLRRQNR
jgi:hypothetical protein